MSRNAHFTKEDELLMRRCFHLARLGSYHVGMNPQVGSVLSHKGSIIGEGYHKKYGGPHAEIEALNNVPSDQHHLLQQSHIYVSLEPCHHHGKTPPCVDTIIKAGIPKVTICNLDPNPATHGKSLTKLREHNVDVRHSLLSEEGLELNKRFFINQSNHLPLIILKWAQSKDGYIGQRDKQIWLSNEISKLAVHRWREEIDGIMIGTNTVITDNPILTNRRTQGRSPLRIVLDRQGRIKKSQDIIADQLPTVIYTCNQSHYKDVGGQKEVEVLTEDQWTLQNILKDCYKKGLSSILIEGGAALLKSIVKEGLWHEARVIHTPQNLKSGIKAPDLTGKIISEYQLSSDKVLIINNINI